MAAKAPDNRRPDPLLSVQMLRAVAATMVLLYHLVTTSAYGWLAKGAWHSGVAKWVEAVGFAGVDLFFVISGVVMVYSSYNRLGSARETIPFVKRRVARIYPLYWICTVSVLGIAWLTPSLASRAKLLLPAVVKSLLLWPQEKYPVVAVGWTLSFEMYFYLAFAGMIALPRRVLPWTLAGWGAITIALFIVFDQQEYRTSLEGHLSLPLVASPLALEFIVGCFIGWRVKRGTTPLGAAALALGFVAFAVIGASLRLRYPLGNALRAGACRHFWILSCADRLRLHRTRALSAAARASVAEVLGRRVLCDLPNPHVRLMGRRYAMANIARQCR